MQGRRERARDVAAGLPLVTADLATVTWLTGLVTDVEWGPNPLSAPPIAVLEPDGSVLLIASADDAAGAGEGVEVRPFPGYAVEDVDRSAAALELALDALGSPRRVAADVASLPGSLAAALVRQGAELVDVAPDLRTARAVKDEDEIAAIRAAVRVADAGQAAARAALAAGRAELEVWAATRDAMEVSAGGRLAIHADVLTGHRTATITGSATPRVVAGNDLLIVDLSPRPGGYWADSCATVALGRVPAHVERAHERARAALELGVATVRPGVRAGDLDAVVREAAGEYPHHTGHGLGVTFHEEPRIVPGSNRVLEAGMVIALEPASYGEAWGVRVEQVVLVTEDGCEVLSQHDLSL